MTTDAKMPINNVQIGAKIVFSYKTGQSTFHAGNGYWDGNHVVTETPFPASILQQVSDYLKDNVKRKDAIIHESIEWSFFVKEDHEGIILRPVSKVVPVGCIPQHMKLQRNSK